jgi:hypothetical protein
MFLLDLDPNVVKPGWTPLIITVLLAAVLVLLYMSMRRQFRRITIDRDEPDAAPSEAAESAGSESPTDSPSKSPN